MGCMATGPAVPSWIARWLPHAAHTANPPFHVPAAHKHLATWATFAALWPIELSRSHLVSSLSSAASRS